MTTSTEYQAPESWTHFLQTVAGPIIFLIIAVVGLIVAMLFAGWLLELLTNWIDDRQARKESS